MLKNAAHSRCANCSKKDDHSAQKLLTKHNRVRFGRHETELFLELRPACPEASAAEELVWWVMARDAIKPGRKAPSSPSSPQGVGK